MGHCGSGKTTLFNKLCNTNYEAGWSKNSLTRGITKHDVAYGNEPMSIIDTPGDNSKEEAMKHAILLSESLTH
jgi:predicted GTPase